MGQNPFAIITDLCCPHWPNSKTAPKPTTKPNIKTVLRLITNADPLKPDGVTEWMAGRVVDRPSSFRSRLTCVIADYGFFFKLTVVFIFWVTFIFEIVFIFKFQCVFIFIDNFIFESSQFWDCQKIEIILDYLSQQTYLGWCSYLIPA